MRLWMTRRQHRTLRVLGVVGLGWLAVGAGSEPRPMPEVPPADASAWTARLAAARTVDLNAAGAAELERLPGIGPRLAGRIVAYRAAHGTFRAPEQLMDVSGIGPETYERVRDRLATP